MFSLYSLLFINVEIQFQLNLCSAVFSKAVGKMCCRALKNDKSWEPVKQEHLYSPIVRCFKNNSLYDCDCKHKVWQDFINEEE